MFHPKTVEWDRTLKQICDRIDERLENEYGESYRLRPNRPEKGTTSNPEMDGLFNVQAQFTPGYRSKKGRGYIIEIELSTLEKVDPVLEKEIRDTALSMMREEIKAKFPERLLEIGLDGNMIKIWGDLSLGSL